MPGWDGSRAGVSGWLLDSLLHAEAPFTPEQKRAQRETQQADESFFKKNPRAGSYVRAYYPGEVAPGLLEGRPGEPEAVAVALVRPGLRIRVAVFRDDSRAQARLLAEMQAKALRWSA
jgi:hypothetical protein